MSNKIYLPYITLITLITQRILFATLILNCIIKTNGNRVKNCDSIRPRYAISELKIKRCSKTETCTNWVKFGARESNMFLFLFNFRFVLMASKSIIMVERPAPFSHFVVLLICVTERRSTSGHRCVACLH